MAPQLEVCAEGKPGLPRLRTLPFGRRQNASGPSMPAATAARLVSTLIALVQVCGVAGGGRRETGVRGSVWPRIPAPASGAAAERALGGAAAPLAGLAAPKTEQRERARAQRVAVELQERDDRQEQVHRRRHRALAAHRGRRPPAAKATRYR